MKDATKRSIVRWIHIIFSIPILGYVYSPVEKIPNYAHRTRFVFVPMMVLSGLWMWAPLKPGVGLSEGVQIFSNLSFRPEPERQRRRSGGTCCPQPAPQPLRHLSEPPVILKERALCAIEGPLHAIRSSQPPQGVLSSPTQGPPLQQRKASPPCHSEAFTTLSFRPEPERQRRRSGEPALSLPKGT